MNDQSNKNVIEINDSCDSLIGNALCDIEQSSEVQDSLLSPSAPPFESQAILSVLNQSFQDVGGAPSAPTYAQMTASLKDKCREVNPTKASNRRIPSLSKTPLLNEPPKDRVQPPSSEVVVDADGFQLIQRNRKRRENIIGSKKVNDRHGIKSAPKIVDIYVGNIDVDVTVEAITEYVKSEIGVQLEKGEALLSRNPNYKSFKLSCNITDRSKLLSPEVWPEGIICRKYYNPRNNNSK